MPVLAFDFKWGRWWLHLTTPDFNIVTPERRPRVLPRVSTTDLGAMSESRYLTTLTWFFHLTVGYGRPLPREDDE